MKSTEIKFAAIHGDEQKAITKIFFDPETGLPFAVKVVGNEMVVPADHVMFVTVTDDTVATTLTLWEEESVEEPVKEPKAKKTKK